MTVARRWENFIARWRRCAEQVDGDAGQADIDIDAGLTRSGAKQGCGGQQQANQGLKWFQDALLTRVENNLPPLRLAD